MHDVGADMCGVSRMCFHIFVHVCMYMLVYVCMYIYIYIYICVCVCVCVCVALRRAAYIGAGDRIMATSGY